ncbi:SPOR domain-containing protein [Acinetobacter tibetensis]|uniref:SPOR domain-containing protein n=1 Tax=Acinetobacter tibetensis TaxID=2943497 RepID=A0AAE9LQN7_9GAMM|nr:SPOR domain-containing protein [Acinetobacter tibetensis]USE82765.1 SPOR domain-containing protein [Acinetobacter tibetensis]
MSMNNKQRWMGGVVLLGGGVLLAALLLKGKEEIHQNNIKHPELVEQVQQQNVKDSGMVQLQGLTVDVETEKRLLEEQRRAREKAVAEQEARAAEFLAQQQQAEADAARKAAEEYAALNAARTGAQQSSDNIPPELVEDEKAKQKRLAEEKLAAQKKLDQQKASQSSEADKKRNEERLKAEAQRKADEERKALAKAAEDKKLREAEAQRKLEAQRKADQERQVAAKAAEEKKLREAEAKRKEDAKKKAEAEKARDLLENGDKQWMVQVALAANAANADSVISKLKAKGYKVVQSPTSKGIRIMVGPAKSRDVADVTRKKITTDASLNMKSAWVIDWVPLDRR